MFHKILFEKNIKIFLYKCTRSLMVLEITFTSSRENCSMLSNATGCPDCSKNLCINLSKTLNPNLESGLSSCRCRHTSFKPEALIGVFRRRSLRSLESSNTILGIITKENFLSHINTTQCFHKRNLKAFYSPHLEGKLF